MIGGGGNRSGVYGYGCGESTCIGRGKGERSVRTIAKRNRQRTKEAAVKQQEKLVWWGKQRSSLVHQKRKFFQPKNIK